MPHREDQEWRDRAAREYGEYVRHRGGKYAAEQARARRGGLAHQELAYLEGAKGPGADDLTARLTPEAAAAGGIIETDEGSLAAQRRALAALEGVYARGGRTPADIAAEQAGFRRVGREARGQREAIEAQAASRGLLGSGLEYAGEMGAQQSAADRAADYEAQLQQAASARALASMQAAGSLGGAVGERTDAISRFNAGYLRDIGERNARRRDAEEMSRVAGEQQGWENRMDLSRERRAAAGEPRPGQEGTRGESAARGAVSGAAAGSAFGPWGALVGGAGGGLVGYLSGEDEEEESY